MAFEKKVWVGGDTVTAAHLNRIENGIAEALGSGGSGALAPPDWNENDPESPAYIQNRPFYETIDSVTLYDGTLTLAVYNGYAQATGSTSIALDTLYDGIPVTITVDGVSEEQTLTYSDQYLSYFCGNPSTTHFGVSFYLPQSTVQIFDFQNVTERSANVSVVSSQNTLVKIPAKYLPDDVVIAGEGVGSTIQGLFGNAGEGANNTATGDYAHVEGGSVLTDSQTGEKTYRPNTASGNGAHAEGSNTTAIGDYSHAEGGGTTASGSTSHAEGGSTTASGDNSHAEGNFTTASGSQSHAEGNTTTASGPVSHAEGQGGTYALNGTTYESGAKGTADHTEGFQTLTANGQPGNHAEGYQTRATGGAAHAEGGGTNASGVQSHAEGGHTTASGAQSHAEGAGTTASGNTSHAEGLGTISNHAAQHVFGQYNVADPSTADANSRGTYVEIVGNGTISGTTESRANARTLDWSGNETLAGSLTLGKGTADEVTVTAAQLKQLIAMLSA